MTLARRPRLIPGAAAYAGVVKLTQTQILEKTLTYEWQPGHSFVHKETPWGWLGTETKRTLRKWAKNGLIDRTEMDGEVHYRKKPQSI